jgi:MFS family permease
MNLSPSLLARIFIPFALGYFLSYLYRVVNTIIAGDLSTDMQLDAGQLGLLTSTYLISFAAVQLPLGILLDRYGPRKIEALLLLFAAGGALVFALAASLGGLIVGRALIGFGVSACLMAAFKAFVQWFPKEKLPLVNGLQFTAGGFGILAASTPVEWALTFTDWRGVFMGLAVLTLMVSLLVFFVVPDKPMPPNQASLKEHIGGILHIFTSRQFCLWAGPWLRDVAGLERAEIAPVLSWLAIGVIAGYFFLGVIAERLNRYGFSTLYVASIGLLMFILVQLALIFEWTSLSTFWWILFGFFGTTGVLAYAYLSQQFAPELAGRVNTALNLLVFVFAFIAQWGIGIVINWYSAGNTDHYNPLGYQIAFSIALVAQVLTMLWYFWQARR